MRANTKFNTCSPFTPDDPDEPVCSNFQAIGPALRVLQLNVKGLSAAKRTLISTIAHHHSIDVICLQETHVADQWGATPLKDLTLSRQHQMPDSAVSVQSPSLFNIYINDLPATQSCKFIYTDDNCIGTQHRTFDEVENVLNKDMDLMVNFLSRWRLQPSATKTVSSIFRLHNAQAKRELSIFLKGQRIKHDPNTSYLGVTLDRSLTYHDHLKKTAVKVSSQNNLLSKLAGTSWGARAQTLKTTALALWYSTAEYCAQVWSRSSHTKLVDVQLNMTANSAWSDEWAATDVVNHSLIAEPSVCPPGFDLPRRHWSMLNRFRMGQGRCAVNLVRWGQATNPNCNCGEPETMQHIVNKCPLTHFNGGLEALHLAEQDAVLWLGTQCKR